MSLNPFKGDPAAALARVHKKLASVESNLIDLRAKRAETLLSAEDASAVVAIDRAIDIELANANIYRDRIKALQEECRRLEFQSREAQRTKSIEKIKEKLDKRAEVAADLQFAIARIGGLYATLMSNEDEVESFWPFPRPGHGFAAIDHRSVRREISWQLHGLIHQFGLPEASSAGLGVVGVSSVGIDGAVKNQNEAILFRLSMVPLAADLLDEDVA
jgi:hypothetical protein